MASVFDLFKLGVGPSSSHTMGPMTAAGRFLQQLAATGLLARVERVEDTLYASLALTGRGHATDRAVILGLLGFLPATIDPDAAEAALGATRASGRLALGSGGPTIAFDEAADILWEGRTRLPQHPNALAFRAYGGGGLLAEELYFSVGGGFVLTAGEMEAGAPAVRPKPEPYPFASGAELITRAAEAGLLPAVLRYYDRFHRGGPEGRRTFLLTAAAIGSLYKRNASISGAEVGCQGEVGVACSMAAAGLTAALGGTNAQVENAAEIAMEHNLGLTCDPIGGLVQIPCIERNAMGAVKAIDASRLALLGDGQHTVSLDKVIATMKRTGEDMSEIYKETSLGGLAVNVVEC